MVIWGPKWVVKNEHFLKKVSWDSEWQKKDHFLKKVNWGRLLDTNNEHFLEKVSWDPMWITKNEHFPKNVRKGPMWVTKKALSQPLPVSLCVTFYPHFPSTIWEVFIMIFWGVRTGDTLSPYLSTGIYVLHRNLFAPTKRKLIIDFYL